MAFVTGAITIEQQPGGEPAVLEEQGTSNVLSTDTGASEPPGVTIEGGGGGIDGAGITNLGTVNIVDTTIRITRRRSSMHKVAASGTPAPPQSLTQLSLTTSPR